MTTQMTTQMNSQMSISIKILLIQSLLSLTLGLSTAAFALPDLTKAIAVDNARVLGDHESSNTYYLVPKGLRIFKQVDGGPHLSLSLLQYVGSNAREDNGRFDIYSTFRIRIGLERHTSEERSVIQARLRQQLNRAVTLRDLPIDQLSANLVSSVGGETTLSQSRQFDEATSALTNLPVSSAWSERDLVMSFEEDEAELLERLLKQKDAGLSLAYSIGSRVWRLAEPELEGDLPEFDNSVSPTSSIEEDLLGQAEHAPSASIEVIAADAIPIRVADEFLESRIKRYFLDGSLPASYPSLVVYYYDMRNGNAEGIFLRHVEIEAAGVSGGNTRYSAFFEAERPQDYAFTVRFPYAVNLREPYRWRASDVLQTGEMRLGPWTESDNWSTIINASGPLPPEPAQPNHGDEQ